METLLPSMEGLRSMEEILPARLRVATIGSLSLRQRPVCDITVSRSNLFRGTDTVRVTHAMHACEQALRVVPREPYTDIRGALSYVALGLQGRRPALRGVVLLSDLDEDLPKGQAPATPNLATLCVAVYAELTDEAARQPTAFVARQQLWQQRLRQWGAKDVLMRTTVGFTPDDLVNFFRGCESE